ncbi:MAG: hypothetical protein KDK97_24525, partial [Verrucomicrobiales bacterium]|nr:hypothetical protein [Verrucomicrobiales bacterium]
MLETDTLIQHYLEGTLSETEAAQLHEMILAQPELGERLLQHFEMDTMLRETKPLAVVPAPAPVL